MADTTLELTCAKRSSSARFDCTEHVMRRLSNAEECARDDEAKECVESRKGWWAECAPLS